VNRRRFLVGTGAVALTLIAGDKGVLRSCCMSDLQPVIDDLRKQASTVKGQADAARATASALDSAATAINADADKLAGMTPVPPDPTPPPTNQTLGQRFGAFSMPLEQVQGVTDAFIAQQGDLMKDLGVGWWRGDYPLRQVCPSKGNYNWTDTDRWVKAALARGIKPLPILYMLPQWLNGSSNDKNPPLNDNDWAIVITECCKHLWGMGVTAVETWNEANLSGFWTGQPATDDAYRGKYVRMMKVAYPMIKAAVPNMVVIVGGLSTSDTVFQSTNQPTPPGCGALSTIQSYASKGMFSNCDALGWHPYLDTDTACKDVGTWPSWSPKAVKAALDIIDAAAPGRGVSLWTTETGCPRSVVGNSQAEQSKRAKDAMNTYMPGGCLNQYNGRLGPFFWFCVIDRHVGDAREDSFGWQSTSGQKYQVYNDMKPVFSQAWPS
jgi:hypothetical protein